LLDNEVLNSDFYLRQVLFLDEDTGVALGHAVFFCSFGCSVVAVIGNKVGSSEFMKKEFAELELLIVVLCVTDELGYHFAVLLYRLLLHLYIVLYACIKNKI
ncbi:MAG: hypothetical protein MJZ41_14590, partial [Bacteroidaceae bacterium]|nr:hypothetical protein [Bacteroidaceae bacterium]